MLPFIPVVKGYWKHFDLLGDNSMTLQDWFDIMTVIWTLDENAIRQQNAYDNLPI